MSRDAASGPNGVFDRGLRRDASIVTHGVFPGFFAPRAGTGALSRTQRVAICSSIAVSSGLTAMFTANSSSKAVKTSPLQEGEQCIVC
jgi:hypothetical protein